MQEDYILQPYPPPTLVPPCALTWMWEPLNKFKIMFLSVEKHQRRDFSGLNVDEQLLFSPDSGIVITKRRWFP